MKKASHLPPPLLLSLLLSPLLLAAGAASAADDAAVLACRALPDNAQRLACYDAMPVAAAAPAQSPEQTFGLKPVAKKAPEPEAIESTIVGEVNGWSQGTVFTLANGQVWRVVDGDAVLTPTQNPQVRISRGTFSAIYLQLVGQNSLARVRRVK